MLRCRLARPHVKELLEGFRERDNKHILVAPSRPTPIAQHRNTIPIKVATHPLNIALKNPGNFNSGILGFQTWVLIVHPCSVLEWVPVVISLKNSKKIQCIEKTIWMNRMPDRISFATDTMGTHSPQNWNRVYNGHPGLISQNFRFFWNFLVCFKVYIHIGVCDTSELQCISPTNYCLLYSTLLH